MNIAFKNFTNGLYLATPRDDSPEGTLRRGRGIHALSHNSARSRAGSTLLHSLNAHSIAYFNDLWHLGVGAELYRSDVSIKSGLSGSRLSFVRMPPTAGVVDYLFCCGGGESFKVSTSGVVSSWGLTAPVGDFDASLIAGGSLTAGAYTYRITFYNSATGTRSNANDVDVSATTAGGNLTVRLTAFPSTSDSQVTHIEIWRTEAAGTLFFYLTRIAITATVFNDDGTVTLSDTELPTDNLQPYSWFTNVAFWNASSFWISNTQSGQRGRIYYSPVGRCEAIQGYLEATNDADPLAGIFTWQGKLGVAAQGRVFEVVGTNPYQIRELSGVPGTGAGGTVSLTPYGVVYEAVDGVRDYTGTDAPLLAYDAIQRLFRGESIDGLSAFTAGIVSAYARGEYFISDGSQTLACNLERTAWRDLGIGCNALYYEPEVDILSATISGSVVSLEAEGVVTDAGAAIPFSVEPAHFRADREQAIMLKRLLVDVNTGGQALTVTLISNDTDIALGSTGTSSARAMTEFVLDRIVDRVGVRITGSLTAAVELFELNIQSEPVQLFVNLHTESAPERQTIIVPGRLVSGGLSLRFDFDESLPLLSTRQSVIVEQLYLDVNTAKSTLAISLGFTDRSQSVGSINNTRRNVEEISINKPGRLVDLTLDGDFVNSVKLYRIELDAYISKGD